LPPAAAFSSLADKPHSTDPSAMADDLDTSMGRSPDGDLVLDESERILADYVDLVSRRDSQTHACAR
jgi:hypothetical protein